MRIFRAMRLGTGRVALVVRDGAMGTSTEIGPEVSLRVVRHSPTGFEMGYGGSGPAQLALAILLEVLPRGDALRLYQKFKESFVAPAPEAGFEVTEEEVNKWALSQP